MTQDEERRPPDRHDARGRIAALVFALALAGALVLIGQAIVRHNALQNCIDSGRRDCAARLSSS